MTFPCVNEQQIDATDGVLSPEPYMQWRHVATASAVNTVLTPAQGGGAINTLINDITATWTNTSPIAQIAYALVTRGGSQMITQARSALFINTQQGVSVGAAPPAPTLALVSRFGGGVDTGVNGIFGVDFAIQEQRCGPRTMMCGSNTSVPAGQQFKARNELRLVSDFWETTGIDGGNGEFESYITVGEVRVDIFAYPSL